MSNKTQDLTEDQKKKLDEYYQEFVNIGLSTQACNRSEAEKAVLESYAFFKKPVPRFIWVDSPFEGARLAAKLAKLPKNLVKNHQNITLADIESLTVNLDDIKGQADKATYGSFDSYWIGFYCFLSEVLNLSTDNLANISRRIAENCGVFWTFDHIAIMSEKPSEIHVKDGVLHNETGYALKYRDNKGIYAYAGEIATSLMDLTVNKLLKLDKKGDK